MTEKLNLEAIEARCEALDECMGQTTWALEGPNHHGLFSVYDSDGNKICYGIEEQQLFIAHARADISALVTEVTRLRAELERATATVALLMHQMAETCERVNLGGDHALHDYIPLLGNKITLSLRQLETAEARKET